MENQVFHVEVYSIQHYVIKFVIRLCIRFQLMARCTRYIFIMLSSFRDLIIAGQWFYRYSGFLHHKPPTNFPNHLSHFHWQGELNTWWKKKYSYNVLKFIFDMGANQDLISVFDWLISKISSPLKLSYQMKKNLVGSTYGKFCIRFPQNIDL
jgi:hypothetical protein